MYTTLRQADTRNDSPTDRRLRCRNCTVKHSALFGQLSPAELDEIAPAVPELTLAPRDRFYDEGDEPNALFILRRGIVKRECTLADGSYRIVGLARRADVLGLESLLGSPTDHAAIALTRVSVCRVPMPVVRHVMARQEWMATRMIHHWHKALSRATDWLAHYSTGGGRQRLAYFLKDLHDWSLEEDPADPLVELPGREDLGAILGITKETASRLITDFRRRDILRDAGPRHVRVDRQKLDGVILE